MDLLKDTNFPAQARLAVQIMIATRIVRERVIFNPYSGDSGDAACYFSIGIVPRIRRSGETAQWGGARSSFKRITSSKLLN